MGAPLVSIVTPVLNGARFLPECLRSVRAQSHAPLEHLVIDGGSSDGSCELAEAAGARVVSGRDRGMYDALRKGFELARGEILGWQNADDRYAHEEAVAWGVAHLQAHSEADLVWGRFRFIDALGEELRARPPGREPARQDAILRYNHIPPHATFVRAAALRGGDLLPDPRWQYAGDWEWFVRLHRGGLRFTHLPRVLADFRLHAASKTSTWRRREKLREWRAICRLHGLSFARLAWNELFWMPLVYRLTR